MSKIIENPYDEDKDEYEDECSVSKSVMKQEKETMDNRREATGLAPWSVTQIL